MDIEAYISEHGVVKALAALEASPEAFGMTKAVTEAKMRLVAQILAVPQATMESIAPLMGMLHALDRHDSDTPAITH